MKLEALMRDFQTLDRETVRASLAVFKAADAYIGAAAVASEVQCKGVDCNLSRSSEALALLRFNQVNGIYSSMKRKTEMAEAKFVWFAAYCGVQIAGERKFYRKRFLAHFEKYQRNPTCNNLLLVVKCLVTPRDMHDPRVCQAAHVIVNIV